MSIAAKLSAIWSQSVTRTLLELERDLLYVVAATALLALAPRCSSRWILGAVPAATARPFAVDTDQTNEQTHQSADWVDLEAARQSDAERR